MKRFDELRDSLHKEGVTIIEYDGLKIPCILINNDRFDELIKYYSNRTLMVDAKLDIWHNESKDVFVNIILEFESYGKMDVLLYANQTLPFFECLAESGMIALIREHNPSNIIMIQLARKDEIEEALNNIRAYMKNGI